jgi:uncharacterized membrane protein YcaP (DUF421 family)
MIDWSKVFLPEVALLEIIVRGTVVYFALFILLRITPRRQAGTLGVADLLVVVLIADAVQNALIGETNSVIDGILVVMVILFWSYLLDWLSYHVRLIEKLVHEPALVLIENGKVVRRNMRRELITMDELNEAMREEGIEDLEHVKKAYMESDGSISFIKAN